MLRQILLCIVMLSAGIPALGQDTLRHEVLLETNKGNIRISLYNETPLHRDNFLKNVREGWYDGLLFHRVISNFMIQTGDTASRHAEPGQLLGETSETYTVPAEFRCPQIYHKRGAVAAAREGDADNPERSSSMSQFYIVYGIRYNDAMLDKTKRIFLEVNDRQPRGLCGSLIHISQVDAIVEYNHDLPVLPPVQLDEVSKTIGGLIAERIPDGACLQLGIGAIPDATGMALKAKHDLGIHTEMFTDSMVELIECGAVNNSKKQIHRGKTVTTFAFGSQRIYDYIDDNPAVEILPVEYVNDPDVICQNDNMISINAAVEVDLFGQVCAESVGTKHMSGSGGQIDYVRGACQSRGGKSFIAFTSTAKGGTISKIKSILTPGAVVTTSKNDVDYIVTEYGVAHLRGRSLGERARQLIAIAHPDFRDELTFEAKKRGIMI